MALISVVIPAYNAEKTIGNTVRSVLKQTFTDFEIIVIDDGSQDNTLSKVNEIKDSRLFVFSHENKGVSTSRNRGLEMVKGKFVAFLDADDLWQPDKLARQLQALKENSKAALAYSWVDCIDENGDFIRHGMRPTVQGYVYKHLLKSNFLECGSTPLIRVSALKQVDGFDPELHYGEDWDMWLRIAKNHEFTLVPAPLVLYRISTNSASFNFEKYEKLKIKAIEKVFTDVPASLKALRNVCLANFYRYLTFKVLDTPIPTITNRHRGFLATRYWWMSVRYSPTLIKQPKVVASTLLKILNLIVWSQPSKLSKIDA